MPDTRYKDLTGQRFGDLEVIEPRGFYTSPKGKRQSKWLCRCDLCGSEHEYALPKLRRRVRDGVRGCSERCAMKKENLSRPVIDLTGQRFGRLTVIAPANEQIKGKSQLWICRCDCGNEITAEAGLLKNGSIQSCGCLKKELAKVKLKKHADEVNVDDTNLDLLTSKPTAANYTGVRGVIIKRGKYNARIRLQGKMHYLGSYETLEEAKEVRRKAEVDLFDPVLEKHGKERTKPNDKTK